MTLLISLIQLFNSSYVSTNIYKIVYNIINGKKRPNYLCRNNLSDSLEGLSYPKFTQSEMAKPC